MSETVGGATFPDTLAVWKPIGQPVAPAGIPQVRELVVFTTMYDDPTRLIELRNLNNSSDVPALADDSGWRNLVAMMKLSAMSGSNSTDPVLTDLLRKADVTDASGRSYGQRGCVRFEQTLRPSASEWQAYRAGSTSWQSLPWVQGIYGSKFGQRQALCRIELQLRPGDVTSNDKQSAIPFFGSAALYYQLKR
ncbi:MAG: hypothetical protein ABI614_06905 [Planctomycetota bacterium]